MIDNAREEGIEQEIITTAKNIDLNIISKVTSLSLKEIEEFY